ncbi:hypothetical protein F511_12460 [Dorcoceras hygrometricum]|uniref:Uncharacterized protein n=1 Tax=Dorcoceras hygrometricum TaxID=472368 RepID=A0A2Z7BKP4_9LAMI|nr:hypothetical protein F511_12460 [Dorcoceras hygrometricum]
MWRDKSPGLKILWLWTFGTAAVLVTNVVRTRMRDMEQLINNASAAQDQRPTGTTIISDNPNGSRFGEDS